MTSQRHKYLQHRKELSVNSMYFNRYLLIRYITAGFFFINLYWFILMLRTPGIIKWLALSLLIVHGGIAIEQASKYWRRNHYLVVTKWGYLIQIVANLIITIGLIRGYGAKLFPFFAIKGLSYALFATVLGLILALLVERKAWLIEHDLDAHYRRLKIFIASLD